MPSPTALAGQRSATCMTNAARLARAYGTPAAARNSGGDSTTTTSDRRLPATVTSAEAANDA